MKTQHALLILATVICTCAPFSLAQSEVVLPQGVHAVWDISKAYREKTPTRERICINGLWRWQPAEQKTDVVPTGNWGFAKVPGPWPGSTGDYMWCNAQTYYAHPAWAKTDLGKVTIAWHQREITIPSDWAGRRIALSMEYLYTGAAVYIDSKKMGEAFFPAGEVDITTACKPGGKYLLSILAAGVPLSEEKKYFAAAGAEFRSKAQVDLRALCGDVFLCATPARTRLTDLKVDTSVRKNEITFNAAIDDPAASMSYMLRAEVIDGGRVVKEFRSKVFSPTEIEGGRFAFTAQWKPDKLWDLNTPANVYQVKLSLLDSSGKTLDAFAPVRFGFREFWIDGRDFYLNGSRIFFFALPLESSGVSVASASYDGAMETFKRLKAAGVNLVYTHNYDCTPGVHLSFAEILRAADDSGVLVALSMPHFSDYEWKAPDADKNNGYAHLAEFYVRVAQNHPAVVMYAMNHNSCGYCDMSNPAHLDGQRDITGQVGGKDFGYDGKLAQRTAAIVQRFDLTRPIYNHSGGNVGSVYTINIYLNMVPIQEKSDWFAHWATQGTKPLFLCEYGTPSDMDWTTFRGYYKGERSFWNGQVPWEECFPEWGSQYRGDKAYDITDKEKTNLRYEAKQWRAGKTWFRWDYPFSIPDSRFDIPNILEAQAMFIPDNWRAFRTWGVSAFNSWEFDRFWKLPDGFKKTAKTFKVDWDNLQRPGYSPDAMDKQFDAYAYAYDAADWIPTLPALALLRNNQPLLAYIADHDPHFTGKEHNFLPGQTVEKQIVLINNSRQTVSCDCQWSLTVPQATGAAQKISVDTGKQERIPVRFDLPAALAPGAYAMNLSVKFSSGTTQSDSLTINVLPKTAEVKTAAKIALFDRKGQTRELLKTLGIGAQSVDANANLSAYDLLIIGKSALAADSPGPNLGRVNDGLKVVVFEQTSDALANRLGFHVQEYGLRWVFKRLPDHPALAAMAEEFLYNWRGQATILPPELPYTFDKYKSPTIKWCGLEVTRPWRVGNWGNVASVLIEKPGCGDFLPILDGGFSLQYSPLLEFRQGKGMILFCQMDVTGRSDTDPAAQRLAANIVEYACAYKPPPSRKAQYIGDPAGLTYLQKAGLDIASATGENFPADAVLIVGPGGGAKLASHKSAVSQFLQGGGHLLAVGLDSSDAAFLPFNLTTHKAEYISTFFDPPAMNSALAGIAAADLMNRDPRSLPLITGGATPLGDGVLATAQNSNVAFIQLVPWQFDYTKQYNLKRTYRRASFALLRILSNMGVSAPTPLLDRFKTPADAHGLPRWREGLYLDKPEEWDDPYRYFCW